MKELSSPPSMALSNVVHIHRKRTTKSRTRIRNCWILRWKHGSLMFHSRDHRDTKLNIELRTSKNEKEEERETLAHNYMNTCTSYHLKYTNVMWSLVSSADGCSFISTVNTRLKVLLL